MKKQLKLISDWNIDSSWTLFLDRDGVINERNWGGYIKSVDEFKFLPGAKKGIATLSNIFKYTFVVTNQQGIGKGLMDESNLQEIHTYMCTEVSRLGGSITECYFAPNLRGAAGDRRKPRPEMAREAQSNFENLDFTKSVMVGDTDSDILFGKNLGMKTVRIRSAETVTELADLDVDSLLEFSIALNK